LRRETVLYQGHELPARHLRFCGPSFRDDAHFVASADREVERLAGRCGLRRENRLLDVGCGYGRLAIGLQRRYETLGRYLGLDVDRRAVAWCRRHLGGGHDGFEFRHLRVANPRYNPAGRRLDEDFRLPVGEGAFDLAYLFSVFSHMRAAEVRIYLRELARAVAPGGRLFLTAFVEADVEPEAVNPPGYGRPWSGPLHCVRFERGFFAGLVEDAGLRIETLDHGVEIDGQSGLYLSRP
jgi:SAM-dependent methyltransferase